MRHQKSGRKFSRTSAHREAMFTNMAASLIKHELIRTTLPKAKELRRVAEPLITLAKNDSVANRRLAFSRLRDKEAVGTLFTTLGPRYQSRPGGYLRILKCGFRAGDNAPMAYVELGVQRVADQQRAGDGAREALRSEGPAERVGIHRRILKEKPRHGRGSSSLPCGAVLTRRPPAGGRPARRRPSARCRRGGSRT